MTQQSPPLLPPQPYPQDRAVLQDAVLPLPLGRRRWSGRRTAVVGAIVLGLTTIGGVAAAAASPNGFTTSTRDGTGFGPGAGRGGFGGGQFGPGPQGRPGLQAPPGRVGRAAH